MQNITINLHSPTVKKALEYLVEIKYIPSLSEGVRTAVRDYLIKELEYISIIGNPKEGFSALAEVLKMEKDAEMLREAEPQIKIPKNIWHPEMDHSTKPRLK